MSESEHVYTIESLSGGMSYDTVIRSIKHWIKDVDDIFDHLEFVTKITKTIENWNAKRSEMLCDHNYPIRDTRLFEYEQLITINNANSTENLIEILDEYGNSDWNFYSRE